MIPSKRLGQARTAPPAVPVAKSVDVKTPPVEQAAKMDAATFFARLNALMKDNPPAAADAEAMKRFAAIGVAPGKPFDSAKLDPAVARGSKGVAVPDGRRSSPRPRSRSERS